MFKVHLLILYGESAEHALGRLLVEIISGSGDVSVQDWAGEASLFNRCFPANLVPYQTSQELYSKLAGLRCAGFENNKLSLPSIIHQVTAVTLQGRSTSPSRYIYAIHASGLNLLEVTLSIKLDKVSSKYILARPWHPKVLPTQTSSDDDVAWELLEGLKQPNNALLLVKLPQRVQERPEQLYGYCSSSVVFELLLTQRPLNDALSFGIALGNSRMFERHSRREPP
ncbi:hypothetical protein EDD16DRAFT_1892766 [Pisolithus croceorrhizus]|nr:hypothetical protein EV401DRAFT_2069217 [Pisolithus croceorrhizus]KAI6127873.1 hypothetical protein EDD16DRAFT_1892766 [Pisolithus croceorrhizus]KAI6150063.1 hypothetical protein EDD17DRAFT_1766134 [Pisolithus thermaeus]